MCVCVTEMGTDRLRRSGVNRARMKTHSGRRRCRCALRDCRCDLVGITSSSERSKSSFTKLRDRGRQDKTKLRQSKVKAKPMKRKGIEDHHREHLGTERQRVTSTSVPS